VGADRGTASNANVPVDRPSKLDAAILRTQAKAALTGLGWKPAIAHAAVASAVATSQGAELTLEQLIRESLRRCPTPKRERTATQTLERAGEGEHPTGL
jgi:hypothetical protein